VFEKVFKYDIKMKIILSIFVFKIIY